MYIDQLSYTKGGNKLHNAAHTINTLSIVVNTINTFVNSCKAIVMGTFE